jgi:hypothetical protein
MWYTPARAISWRGLPCCRVIHSSSAMASHSGRSVANHSLNERARASVAWLSQKKKSGRSNSQVPPGMALRCLMAERNSESLRPAR